MLQTEVLDFIPTLPYFFLFPFSFLFFFGGGGGGEADQPLYAVEQTWTEIVQNPVEVL